jgi:hypothetical protein
MTYYVLRLLAVVGIVWEIRERRPPRVRVKLAPLVPLVPVPVPVVVAAE